MLCKFVSFVFRGLVLLLCSWLLVCFVWCLMFGLLWFPVCGLLYNRWWFRLI